MELPDDAWADYCDERRRTAYQSHLAAHPHPHDPDHPEPEEYGLEDENE